MKKFIEAGIEKTKTQKELGDLIGVSSLQITQAKAGRAGLPVSACYKLAELIEEDAAVVVAASELITEKNPSRRAYWQKKLETLAACVLLASVTNFVTPSPAQAAPTLQVTDLTLYIM